MSEKGIRVTEQEFVDFATSSPLFPWLLTEQQARLVYDALVQKGWILINGERFKRIQEIIGKIPRPYYSYFYSLEGWKNEATKYLKELSNAVGESEK
jgi:hypothetical protein